MNVLAPGALDVSEFEDLRISGFEDLRI